ncbi:MAG TPA: 50S ribosomal protein L29 [Dehalococcoidia bacterium]|nr:50S ribosomal protein L29 [Dehalococcoidia bacterium]
MKYKEILAMTDAELAKRIEESREELFRLRFRLATRQLDNFREIRKTKRTIARLLTDVRHRQLASEESHAG